MSTTHACPGRCGQQVRRSQLACRDDWYRLPVELRRLVQTTYREGAGGAAGHMAAVRDALEWYRRNPRPATP